MIAVPGQSSHWSPLPNHDASAAPAATQPASKICGARIPQATTTPINTEKPTRGPTMAPTPYIIRVGSIANPKLAGANPDNPAFSKAPPGLAAKSLE